MKFVLFASVFILGTSAWASVIEPDDSQIPACYAGYDADVALRDLTRSRFYVPRFSKALSHHDRVNLIGVQVSASGVHKVTVIPPCGLRESAFEY